MCIYVSSKRVAKLCGEFYEKAKVELNKWERSTMFLARLTWCYGHISFPCAKSLQSCLTLCKLMDCSPSGSSVHRISQVRILEWVAISSSRGSSWPRDWTWISRIAGRFFTIWASREAPNFPYWYVNLMRFQWKFRWNFFSRIW